MQILVNTNAHVGRRESLAAEVEATVAGSLDGVSDRITRVEVHLIDEKGENGQNDKRCLMEAFPEGWDPTAVICHSTTLEQALAGAVDRLKRALEGTLERQRERRQ